MSLDFETINLETYPAYTIIIQGGIYLVLYKYRSDSEFTENIFTNKQIWLATPDTLNDPFECSYNIPLDLMQAHIETSCKAQISGFAFSCAMFAQKGRTPFGIPQNEIDEFWKSLKPVFSIKEDYRLFREFQKKHGLSLSDQESTFDRLKKAVKEVGIFSLSSEIDNQLLWAHYADESRGIAIGFCVTSDSRLSSSEHCFKVEYSDDISEKRDIGFNQQVDFYLEHDDNLPQKMRFSNTTKIPLSDPFFQRVISTKPTAWSYEREWRYVEETAGLFPLPAPICEVVFGLRVEQKTIEKYKKLAIESNGNIQFFQMKKSSNKNILEKCPIQ